MIMKYNVHVAHLSPCAIIMLSSPLSYFNKGIIIINVIVVIVISCVIDNNGMTIDPTYENRWCKQTHVNAQKEPSVGHRAGKDCHYFSVCTHVCFGEMGGGVGVD